MRDQKESTEQECEINYLQRSICSLSQQSVKEKELFSQDCLKAEQQEQTQHTLVDQFIKLIRLFILSLWIWSQQRNRYIYC